MSDSRHCAVERAATLTFASRLAMAQGDPRAEAPHAAARDGSLARGRPLSVHATSLILRNTVIRERR